MICLCRRHACLPPPRKVAHLFVFLSPCSFMLLQRRSNQLRDVAIRADDDDGGRASRLPLSAHALSARSERRRLAEWVLRRCQPPWLSSLRCWPPLAGGPLYITPGGFKLPRKTQTGIPSFGFAFVGVRVRPPIRCVVGRADARTRTGEKLGAGSEKHGDLVYVLRHHHNQNNILFIGIWAASELFPGPDIMQRSSTLFD